MEILVANCLNDYIPRLVLAFGDILFSLRILQLVRPDTGLITPAFIRSSASLISDSRSGADPRREFAAELKKYNINKHLLPCYPYSCLHRQAHR